MPDLVDELKLGEKFHDHHLPFTEIEAADFDFQGVKSRRSKAYIDLRMAVEAILKAVICLRSPYSEAGKKLVTSVRRFGHKIDELQKVALSGMAIDTRYLDAVAKCEAAPVDLRYQFDAKNYRMGDDRPYYDTIGSDAWLRTLEEFVETGLTRVQRALDRRSKFVSGDVAIAELARKNEFEP